MRKEMRKMKVRGIVKILFALLLSVVVIFVLVVQKEELETAAIVTVSICWGVAALIYIIAGITNIKNDSKKAKEYIRTYPYGEEALEGEFNMAENHGRLRLGGIHAFVAATDDFHIIPYVQMEDVYLKNHGRNRAKLRNGYYYLYIKIKGQDRPVKIYYMFERDGNQAYDMCFAKMIQYR